MLSLPLSHVLVPIDFSAESPAVIQTALELADGPEAVRVLHVLYSLERLTHGAPWPEVNDEGRATATRERFEQFRRDNGLPELRFDVLLGDPGVKITEHARELHADLIVIASHGHHGLKRLLLGSVAERILRHAHCPVLVLRRGNGE
ncbi:MAG: universal stress protein [Planctomycetaceae bacterium]